MSKSQLVRVVGASLPQQEALPFYEWVLIAQPSKRQVELKAMQYGMSKSILSRESVSVGR